MNTLKNKRASYLNIIIPTFITLLLFILAFFLLVLPGYKKSILFAKESTLQELTCTAISIMERYKAEADSGLITEDEARGLAMESIKNLRYGPEHKDYFWITDTIPVMIMHPYRSDLDGKNVADFEDLAGNKLFSEFVAIAKQNGQGYYDYYWQWKDNPENIVLKRSFIKEYAPWGWIIGTGIYIEDAHMQIARMTTYFIRISLVISALGIILLFIIIMQSVSLEKQRSRAVKQLTVSEKRMRELNVTKDRLFSVIAHDLRTPFNTILGFTEILTNSPDCMESTDKSEIMVHLNTQIKRTLGMLENLLNWAKAQTGQLKVAPEKFYLPDLLNDTVSELKITAGTKDISIQAQSGNSAIITTDPDLLRVVIRNILSNAIKFSHQGSVIRISTEHYNAETLFSIEDQGIGMDREIAKSIFEPGASETRNGTAREKGTGLGLVICKEFVEILGGKIWVESEVGKGSIFKFTVPDPAEQAKG